MRVAKTKYHNLTTKELLDEADRQGLNLSPLCLEMMNRLDNILLEAVRHTPELLDRQMELPYS